MGMTIDEAIDRLEDLHFEQDNWEYEKLTEDCLLNREALRLAINTMREYQKIVQIMERTVDDGTSMYDTLQEIEEVIADRSEEE